MTKKIPPRGFAAMSLERRREIAARGGASVPAEKRSFSQDRTLARKCGTKGGMNVDPKTRAFYKDRTLAANAGRKGGQVSAASRRPPVPPTPPTPPTPEDEHVD